MPSSKFLDSILLILGLLLSLLLVASIIQLILGGDVLQTFHRVTSNVIYFMFGLTIFLIIVVLVLENSSPVHTLAWIMVLIFIPVVGLSSICSLGETGARSSSLTAKSSSTRSC